MSSGSACTSASLEPSYVLRALGVEEEMAHTSIRYGMGRFTTEAVSHHGVSLPCPHHPQPHPPLLVAPPGRMCVHAKRTGIGMQR